MYKRKIHSLRYITSNIKRFQNILYMRNIITFLFTAVVLQQGIGQEINPIITGVPFLTIAADARAGALGDMGVATSSDAYSQQHNAAKYAFAEQQQAFSMNYTPYMAKIASGMSLGQLTYYNRYSERSAIGASLRYFGMGDIEMRDSFDQLPSSRKPNEFAVDVSYSLKLSEKFAMAVTGRFINSNLKFPTTGDANANASTFAVDIAGYFQSNIQRHATFEGRWRAGFNIQNLGPKIKYDDIPDGDFLPTTLKLGLGYDFILDRSNIISVTGEVSKYLVPSPPTDQSEYLHDYRKTSWLSGIFKSFGDGKDFSESMKEVMWALSAEYNFDNKFAFRTGYFHESKEKGARQFATFGAGFKYNAVTIDMSYLMSTSKINNPLENTLRFSLTFDLNRKRLF